MTFDAIPDSAFPPDARERVGQLVPMVSSRLHRMRPSQKTSDLANFDHLPPPMAVMARGLLDAWHHLARRLDVAVTSPLSPCCGPSCTAIDAPTACSHCQVARFHSMACLRSVMRPCAVADVCSAAWPVHKSQCRAFRGLDPK